MPYHNPDISVSFVVLANVNNRNAYTWVQDSQVYICALTIIQQGRTAVNNPAV